VFEHNKDIVRMTGIVWLIIGMLAGAAVGGILGSYRSCPDGSCPLASSPGRGALTGAVFSGFFTFILLGGGSCPLVSFLSGGGGAVSAEPYVSSLPSLNGENFDDSVAKGVVLVDFWADWCGPCQTQLPILDALAPEVQEDFAIAKVNVDEHKDLAKKYGVRRLPTLIFFRDGQPVKTLVGVHDPDALRKEFRALSGNGS
jgi:thioredoxin 1